MTDTANSTQPADARPSYDDVNTPLVVFVGVIASLATITVILFVQGLFYHWKKSELRVRADEVEHMPSVVEINQQKKLLEGGDGIASIDVAMKEVIATFGSPAVSDVSNQSTNESSTH